MFLFFFILWYEVNGAGGGSKYGDWRAVSALHSYEYNLKSKYLSVVEIDLRLVCSSLIVLTMIAKR
jgi:hypothetical protein